MGNKADLFSGFKLKSGLPVREAVEHYHSVTSSRKTIQEGGEKSLISEILRLVKVAGKLGATRGKVEIDDKDLGIGIKSGFHPNSNIVFQCYKLDDNSIEDLEKEVNFFTNLENTGLSLTDDKTIYSVILVGYPISVRTDKMSSLYSDGLSMLLIPVVDSESGDEYLLSLYGYMDFDNFGYVQKIQSLNKEKDIYKDWIDFKALFSEVGLESEKKNLVLNDYSMDLFKLMSRFWHTYMSVIYNDAKSLDGDETKYYLQSVNLIDFCRDFHHLFSFQKETNLKVGDITSNSLKKTIEDLDGKLYTDTTGRAFTVYTDKYGLKHMVNFGYSDDDKLVKSLLDSITDSWKIDYPEITKAKGVLVFNNYCLDDDYRSKSVGHFDSIHSSEVPTSSTCVILVDENGYPLDSTNSDFNKGNMDINDILNEGDEKAYGIPYPFWFMVDTNEPKILGEYISSFIKCFKESGSNFGKLDLSKLVSDNNITLRTLVNFIESSSSLICHSLQKAIAENEMKQSMKMGYSPDVKLNPKVVQ